MFIVEQIQKNRFKIDSRKDSKYGLLYDTISKTDVVFQTFLKLCTQPSLTIIFSPGIIGTISKTHRRSAFTRPVIALFMYRSMTISPGGLPHRQFPHNYPQAFASWKTQQVSLWSTIQKCFALRRFKSEFPLEK